MSEPAPDPAEIHPRPLALSQISLITASLYVRGCSPARSNRPGNLSSQLSHRRVIEDTAGEDLHAKLLGPLRGELGGAEGVQPDVHEFSIGA